MKCFRIYIIINAKLSLCIITHQFQCPVGFDVMNIIFYMYICFFYSCGDRLLCPICTNVWDGILASMYVPSTYAEGVVVLAAAWFFKIDIWVATDDRLRLPNPERAPWTKIPGNVNGTLSCTENDTIRIANIRQSHFQSLHHNDEIFIKPSKPAPRRRKTPTEIKVSDYMYIRFILCIDYCQNRHNSHINYVC